MGALEGSIELMVGVNGQDKISRVGVQQIDDPGSQRGILVVLTVIGGRE